LQTFSPGFLENFHSQAFGAANMWNAMNDKKQGCQKFAKVDQAGKRLAALF
jgi:hypothetical protein